MYNILFSEYLCDFYGWVHSLYFVRNQSYDQFDSDSLNNAYGVSLSENVGIHAELLRTKLYGEAKFHKIRNSFKKLVDITYL